MARCPACAVAAVFLLAGCGGSDDEPSESAKRFSGQERDVAQVLEDFEKASRDGDMERVCDKILSQRVVKQAEQRGERCRDGEDDLRSLVERFGGKDEFEIDVRAVEISAKAARARIRYSGGGQSRTERISLLKEGDRWVVGVRSAA